MEDMEVRRTGRTTRLIDETIQSLFLAKSGEYVEIKDHYRSLQADRMLVDKIKQRLWEEHRVVLEYDPRKPWTYRIKRTQDGKW